MRDVLTLEWVKAVQDCLRDLAAGKNIETGPGVRRHCNDVRVWLDAAPAGAPARGPSLCGNLRVFAKTIDGVVTVFHSVGQVGDTIFAEAELGALSSVLGDYVCAKVVMDDSDGSTVETVEAFSTIPAATATTSYLLLATISAEGAITQQACGPLVVLTCRNFYAAAAPFYSLYLALN